MFNEKCGGYETHDMNAKVEKISNTSFFIFYFFGYIERENGNRWCG